jgi:hypothetical protein
MHMKTVRLSGALAIAALVGCGGSSSGGGGGFTTSVPSGTKLTALTPAQAQQLCTDFDSYAAKLDSKTNDCKESGFFAAEETELEYTSPAATDAQLQMSCTAGYNACLSADGGYTTSTSDCDPTNLGSEPTTCTATVGDATTCFNDLLTIENNFYASIPSCSSLTTASLNAAIAAMSTDGGAVALPASCTKFDATCSTSSSTNTYLGLVKAHRR